MLRTFIAIALIALLDSLNPATIAQAAVFAGTKHPSRAVIGFWLGAMMTYLVTGLLVLAGLSRLISDLAKHPPDWLLVVMLVIGIGVAVGGVITWRRRHSQSIGGLLVAGNQRTAFSVGIIATVTDLPTALPYFAAIGLITSAGLNSAQELSLMLTYNLIYLLPVLLVLALRLIAGKRAEAKLEAITAAFARWSDRVIAVLMVVGGVALALYAGFELLS
ncbi:MAG: GAP family protein [Solirubrobacterales bacterium]|nr:GAP family protein [Solirubrobacterales bacterium]